MKPYVATLPRPAHTAHRGGSLLAPENTLAAFRAAVERWRTDVLELDVRPSRDGEVMVFHDETLERTTDGTGPVDALTARELKVLDAGFHHEAFRGKGVVVPTLDEVLQAFPSTHVNIELKAGDRGFMDAFASVVRNHRAEERVCIGYVDEEKARALLAKMPGCASWYPQDAVFRFFMQSREDAPFEADVYDVLSVPLEHLGVRVVDERLVKAAHAQGKQVHAWTIDDPATMAELLDLGVDSVLTDRPDLLRAVMDGR